MPYSLLLDPVTGQAAAYTLDHQLITELASKLLVQFALENTAQEAAFDRAEHAARPHRRPLPDWATGDVLDRLKVIWIKRPDGEAPAEEWLAIPAK